MATVQSARSERPASPYAISPKDVQGWVVYLFSSKSKKSAEREIRRYRAKDIKARYIPVNSKGNVWYHVLVSGFASERKAAEYKKFLKESYGIDAWYNNSAHRITKVVAKQVADAKKSRTKKTVRKVPQTGAVVSHAVRFRAVDADVWLQIFAANKSGTRKGKMLKEVLLKPGQYTTINTSTDALWITSGNAPALTISMEGKLLAGYGTLGSGNKVLRNYRLNIDKN